MKVNKKYLEPKSLSAANKSFQSKAKGHNSLAAMGDKLNAKKNIPAKKMDSPKMSMRVKK